MGGSDTYKISAALFKQSKTQIPINGLSKITGMHALGDILGWVDNIRAMISLQNALWINRSDWNHCEKKTTGVGTKSQWTLEKSQIQAILEVMRSSCPLITEASFINTIH